MEDGVEMGVMNCSCQRTFGVLNGMLSILLIPMHVTGLGLMSCLTSPFVDHLLGVLCQSCMALLTGS